MWTLTKWSIIMSVIKRKSPKNKANWLHKYRYNKLNGCQHLLALYNPPSQFLVTLCSLSCLPCVMAALPKISPPTEALCPHSLCVHSTVWTSAGCRQVGSNKSTVMLRLPLGGAHLVLLLRLSTVCRNERWAWSSSRVEQSSSSSSSMMPHCTQRRRGSRCPALQTQAVARDWGNSSITKGSRWAGSVSMLVAMVNVGPNVRMMSCRQWNPIEEMWRRL